MPVELFLVIVFAICFCLTAMQGIWNNAITLINTVLAALLATNYWEPLARTFEGWNHTYTYLCDILAIWLVFGISFLILRAFTDRISQVKVRFLKWVDRIGGALLAAWASWVIVCFTAMTLHLAPLAPNFMLGSFASRPESRMLMGVAPDRKWLGLMQKVSSGSLSRMTTNTFDPEAEIIPKYHTRRAQIEEMGTLRTP